MDKQEPTRLDLDPEPAPQPAVQDVLEGIAEALEAACELAEPEADRGQVPDHLHPRASRPPWTPQRRRAAGLAAPARPGLAGAMRVTVCSSPDQTTTTILRELDDDRRRLIISIPWGQPPGRTVAAIWNQLTVDEQVEVAAAFGLDEPGHQRS